MKRKKTFGEETAHVWREFRIFVEEHKRGLALTGALILAVWGALVFRTDIGVDTEIMIAFPETMLKSWCGIGRYGLVFTKRLFGLSRFSQPAAMAAMMGALWLLCMAVGFAVEQWSAKDKRYRFFYGVFSAVYVTAPCLAEQFYFQLQAFEVTWGLLLIVVSVFAAGRFIYWKGSPWWILLSVVCGTWALGSYQVMASVFIALSAFSFLLSYQRGAQGRGEEKKGGWFGCAVMFVGIFMLILVSYLAVSSLVRGLAGAESAYIGDMIMWKKEGIRMCLYHIKTDMQNIYFGKQIFYSGLGLPILVLAGALFLYRGRQGSLGERILYVMAGGFFVFSPTCMTILTGYYQGVRVQMVYPFVLAVSAGVLSTVGTEEKRRRLATGAALCLSAAVAWNQWVISERLLDTAHMASVQDMKKCQDIYEEARLLALAQGRDIREMSLVFVGTQEMETNESTLKGDVIGHSMFQWDADSIVGVSERVGNLMHAIGLSHEKASQQQYVEARVRAEGMPSWPLAGSVVIEGDAVIIKLSDPVY